MQSDWLKLVMWLLIDNQSALFQSSIAILKFHLSVVSVLLQRDFKIKIEIQSMEEETLGSGIVKWSACSPSTPTIRVRILLKSTVFIR